VKVEERYQLAGRFRRRYLAASKAQKGQLLGVFCEVTGYSRKHAMTVLRGRVRKPSDGHGRTRIYGEEFTAALRVLWEATYYVCAERLQPFMGELADLLVRHGQLELPSEIHAQLRQASVSTVERRLQRLRVEVRGKRRSYSQPGAVLRREIPWRQHCHRADDIATAIRIADEFGYDLVIDHGTEAHLLADILAARGIPVIIGPLLTSRSKIELRNRSLANPGRLARAGVTIAITTDHPVVPINFLAYQAALSVKDGLDRETALRALTINPARIAGIDERLGSIEVGKLADIVLWRPAFFGSRPELVVKGGLIVWAQMGDANASIPTPQPLRMRPMFGAFGRAPGSISLAFVSRRSLDEDVAQNYGLGKRLEAVRGCRSLGKRDMKLNDVMPRMRVDAETYTVSADGEELRCEPASRLPLAQRYFLF